MLHGSRRYASLGVLVAAGLGAACSTRAATPRDDSTRAQGGEVVGVPQPLAVTKGFEAPEALVYDSAQDVFFVSNINGTPGARDGNGFISRVAADGKVLEKQFIGGGKNGIRLNSPMGSRIRGDTLWFVDIDKLYAFNARSGRKLKTIDFAPLHARLLNDFDFAPGGTVYVTDIGMTASGGPQPKHTGPDRIYQVGRNGKPSTVLQNGNLQQPDGIAWDSTHQSFYVTPFGGKDLMTWRLGDSTLAPVAPNKGKLDGIEVERDGRVLLTAWEDSSVFELRGRSLTPLVSHLASPSDVSLDTRRSQIGVTLMNPGEMRIYPLSTGTVATRGDTAQGRGPR